MQDLVEIDFDEVVHETASAVLIRIDKDEHWIPESQIKQQYDTSLEIPEWLAIEEGLV